MKNLILSTIATLAILAGFSSCNSDCKEVMLEPCGEQVLENTERCGMTVATCYAENRFGDVAVIYDTRYNSTAPQGDNWGAPTAGTAVTAIHPAGWTEDKIGQVFGIAIDDSENIYLASSDIYFAAPTWVGIPSYNAFRPNTAGRIFKCVPPTWTPTVFIDLPNTNDPLNGIGNIAFDKWNKQFFASNLEDGKIYRIDMVTATIVETYDPWAADSGAPGIVTQDERVWGVGVNYEGGDVKVYFPRVTANERSLYSITLNDRAFPPPASEVAEITNLPGTQEIISDIAFSSDNEELLISERSEPHDAQVNSYTLSGGSWSFNTRYEIGGVSNGLAGNNSAGGVDFYYTELDGDPSAKCDENFWASGNFMDPANSTMTRAYGLQGISYGGNLPYLFPDGSATAYNYTDLFIDLDGLNGTDFKGNVGDVEVFDCTACLDPCTLSGYIK